MVLDYRWNDYICKYIDGDEYKKGLCFAHAFNFVIDNFTFITYRIPIEKTELNYVFISEEEMLNYFVELSATFSFKIISFRKKHDEYQLQIAIPIKKGCYRYPLYISTFIRYVWEHPFSIAVKCALKNRNTFTGLNITTIIQFYLGVFCNKRKCHHHGYENMAFTNMHPKAQYNNFWRDFNDRSTLKYITNKYSNILTSIEVFNIKCIDQICDSINKLANEVYGKYKKDICCW